LKSLISIDVYYDTICPWCYIGKKNLQFATNKMSNSLFKILWRPFQLNPDMPLEGINRKQYLQNKFGGKEKAQKTYQLIHNAGLKNGIHFQFEKINKTPNSFASHKLLALAHKYNKQDDVIEDLFYSYFIEGIDIGNVNELIKIAKQNNIFDKKTLNYLKSDEDRNNLLAEESQARDLGINGVPCFIINKEYVLFGAQNTDKFLEIFNNFSK